MMLAAVTLSAQSAAQFNDWNTVKALAAGVEIRVETGSRKTAGRFQSATDDTIVLRSGSGDQSIARSDVRGIAAKKPGHRKRNVLIGLGVGAGAGAGIAISASHCTGFCVGSSAVEAGSVPLLAGIGALIGWIIPTGGWNDVYRSAANGPGTR